MADNITLPSGVLAADDISSVLYQRVKPSVGADGAAVDVSASAPIPAYNVAQATGGCTIFRSLDVDESEDEVKATAGTLYGGIVMNMTAAVLYLKFYNAAAAAVTVGTTTPVMTMPIPTLATTNGAGFTLPIPSCGIQFDTGICVAVTTALADADTGAPGANSVIVNLWYE
jgi:hypothetical protein